MERICVGMILGAFGIKGEVKVFSYTDFAQKRFKKGNKLYLENEQTHEVFEVTALTFRIKDNILIVRFLEFTTPEEVNNYKNFFVKVNKEEIHNLKKDQYYIRDLITMKVYKKDVLLGEVISVESNGRQDLIRIKMENKKEVLVPMVDAWIESISLDNKQIFLKETEGLFE